MGFEKALESAATADLRGIAHLKALTTLVRGSPHHLSLSLSL